MDGWLRSDEWEGTAVSFLDIVLEYSIERRIGTAASRGEYIPPSPDLPCMCAPERYYIAMSHLINYPQPRVYGPKGIVLCFRRRW